MEKFFVLWVLQSMLGRFSTLLPALYGVSLSTAGHIHFIYFTQRHCGMLFGPWCSVGGLFRTELGKPSCFSVVPSLLCISYIWSSEKQDTDRRHGLEVKWNICVLLILTELEVFVLWFCNPSPKSSRIWAGCVERSLRVGPLLHVRETRLLKSSSFWKHSWSHVFVCLSTHAWADKLSSNFIWFWIL